MEHPQLSPRVLIVEDELVVAADLERSLKGLGYRVVSVTATSKGAIRMAEKEWPDLVLMDIQLKGNEDGIVAADEITKRWQIPVVFVTANTDNEMLARAKEAGPYGYLIKPFRLQELNGTILVALHQHRRIQELFAEHNWPRTMLDGVIAVDNSALVRYMNPVAEKLTGWPIAEAMQRHVREVYAAATLSGEPLAKCQLEEALETQASTARGRSVVLCRDGRRTAVAHVAEPIWEQGQLRGAITFTVDITELLRKEDEARRLEREVASATEALGQTRAEMRALSAH